MRTSIASRSRSWSKPSEANSSPPNTPAPPETEVELKALRSCTQHGLPFDDDSWIKKQRGLVEPGSHNATKRQVKKRDLTTRGRFCAVFALRNGKPLG